MNKPNLLDDYSGELIPRLSYESFSREAIERLLGIYGAFFRALDGFWYLTAKEMYGNSVALGMDRRVWVEFCPYEMKRLSDAMNIHGQDVPTAMKAIQLNPWLQQNDFSMEVVDSNHGILTVFRCCTLEALEREGSGREEQICQQIDPEVFQAYTSYFNPRIRVNCLKSPPRKSTAGGCCKWEFLLA